jgi:hypothetical protein
MKVWAGPGRAVVLVRRHVGAFDSQRPRDVAGCGEGGHVCDAGRAGWCAQCVVGGPGGAVHDMLGGAGVKVEFGKQWSCVQVEEVSIGARPTEIRELRARKSRNGGCAVR